MLSSVCVYQCLWGQDYKIDQLLIPSEKTTIKDVLYSIPLATVASETEGFSSEWVGDGDKQTQTHTYTQTL